MGHAVRGYLEHYNITTSDFERLKTFFLTLFDNYHVRYEGWLDASATNRIKYAHVGDESTYIAIQATPENQSFEGLPDHYFNHYCFIVDDLEETKRRLSTLGVTIDSQPAHPYRKRLYCRDFDNNRYEIIEYLTGEFGKDHSYVDDE